MVLMSIEIIIKKLYSYSIEDYYYIFSVPPMFWIPSQLEGAYVSKDVTLECHSEAFPKSINYWVKEDGAMLISS